MKVVDLTGVRFRHLRITGRAPSRRISTTGQAVVHWKVVCDCGRKAEARSGNLRAGKVQTCQGDLCPFAKAVRSHAGEGVSAKRHIFTMYKGRAKRRKVEFALTRDEFYSLTESACRYCGESPSNIARREAGSGVFIYNGIDRIDPKQGYVTSNVCACCWICNRMKGTLTRSEFLSHLAKVYEHGRAA